MKKRIIFVFIVLTLAISMVVFPVIGLVEHNSLLEKAFAAITEADDAGGDVASLLEEMNMALDLIRIGREDDLAKAERILEVIIEDARVSMDTGVLKENMKNGKTILIVSILVAFSALTWRYGSRLFWRAWLITKRGWVVEN